MTTRFYTRAAIQRIRKGECDPYVSLRWPADSLGNEVLARGGPSGKSRLHTLPPPTSPGVESADANLPTPDEKARFRALGNSYPYRLPDPTSRKDIEYYRDIKNRGYLRYMVNEGEGPSLFFKPLEEVEKETLQKGRKLKIKTKQRDATRVW